MPSSYHTTETMQLIYQNNEWLVEWLLTHPDDWTDRGWYDDVIFSLLAQQKNAKGKAKAKAKVKAKGKAKAKKAKAKAKKAKGKAKARDCVIPEAEANACDIPEGAVWV